MKKIILILIIVTVIAASAVLAVTYGSLRYGVGLYGIGEDAIPPIINISMFNNSGFSSGNFSFLFNVSDDSNIDNCSLRINNNYNLSNDSVQKDINIDFDLSNLSIGRYNFSINCTDNFNNFAISPSFIITIVYMNKFNGSTTNISSSDLRNVTNFVAEVSDSGKINFSDYLNLSNGFDLDGFINISHNKIALDSESLSALNTSATLSLYGLTFSNPRIAKDGVVCPESICKKLSYSGGILVFNVTQWSSYSAEETPGGGGETETGGGAAAGGSGGGGGGGGGGAPPIPIVIDFSTDKTVLKVVLKQGQTKTEAISIKNTGTSIFDVKMYLSEIEKFKISPEENEVITTLQPNEEKEIELIFNALKNEKPDIYPAKITLKGPSIEKYIDTVIEVDSAEPLFDVDVEILPDSKKIFPGEELLLEVNLFNVRGFGRVDVGVEYAIKDFSGNVVASEHETLAVETQAKFSRSLLVPSDLKPGNYVALVKVVYGDSIGTSSDLFEVKAKTIKLYPIQIKDYRIVLLISGAILLVVILIFSAYKLGYLKTRAPKGKVEEIKQFKEEEKSQKLRKELEAIEQAYKSGFISEESYQRSKSRIEEKLKVSK